MCGISDAHSSRCMNQHEEVSNQFIFCAAASARVPAPTRQRSNRGQERNQGERARNFIAMEFLPLKSASVQLWPFQKFLEYFFFSVVYRFSLSLSLSTVDGFSCSHIITVSFAKIRKKKAAPTEWAAQNEKNNRKMREERPTYSVRHWRDLLERNTRPRVEPEKISSQNEVKQRVFSRSFTSTTKTNKRQQVCHWSQVLVRSLLCSFA